VDHGDDGPRAVLDSDNSSTQSTAESEDEVAGRPSCASAPVKAAPVRHTEEEEPEEEWSWVSPWGAASFAAGTLALLQASLTGVWWLTIGLGILGLVLIVQGVLAAGRDRSIKDSVWFTLGGVVNLAVLGVALIAPGLLNRLWALDKAVEKVDPNPLMLVSRGSPHDVGKPMSSSDWADGREAAIRQESLHVRLESLKPGQLPGKSDAAMVIHVRILNWRHERIITVEPFATDTHCPVLTDEKGKSYPFVTLKMRKPAKGAPVFVAESRAVDLDINERQEYLLYFAAPAGRSDKLKLEIPASAWGLQGTLKFAIAGFF
jgi:hypothetical protein